MHGAGEGGGEVEAEAVDAHFLHPVAQGVGDQPQHLGLDDMQGVAAAGVVGVVAGVVGEPVVAGVGDAAQREGGAALVGLGGVVVDDVEDDLDAGGVQGGDHVLELADLLAPGAGGGVAGVRGEVADGVVAPVVAQSASQQVVLVGELMDGQQFDGGDAERGEVVEGGGVGESGVGAAQCGRDAGVAPGEAADVKFVDDGVGPGGFGAAVVGPGVGPRGFAVVGDDALGDVRGGVAVVADGVGGVLAVPVAGVAVHLGRQGGEFAVDGAGVGVEQQFGGVPAGAGGRVPGAVHAVAVAGAGPDAGEEAVPDLVGDLFERVAGLVVGGVVEEADLDAFGAAGPQGEVGALGAAGSGVEAGAERLGPAGPDLGAPFVLGCPGHVRPPEVGWGCGVLTVSRCGGKATATGTLCRD